MTAWLAQHGRSVTATLARFGRTPLTTLLSFLVIGIALSLPAGLYVVVENVRAASPQAGADPQVSAFMALDATRAEVAQIEARLKQNPRVEKFRKVPREQALQQLKQASGLADIVDSLPENPLPDAFVINARDSAPEALEALRDEVRQWPRVAQAQRCQEFLSRGGLCAESAEHAAGDHRHTWLMDASRRHAVMRRLDHHGHPHRLQHLVHAGCDFGRHLLLDLKPSCIHVHEACQL